MTFHVCFFIVCKDFFSGQKYVFVYFDGNTLFYTFQATSFKGVLVEKNYTFFSIFFLKGEVLSGKVVLCQRSKAFV